MSHHYKRYSIEQLKNEKDVLKAKLEEAERLKQKNYIAVYKRKIEIVESYMLDQNQFQPGDKHRLKDDPNHLFEIDEISGVVAWGYRIDKNTYEQIDKKDTIAKLLTLLGEKVSFDKQR